MGGIELVGLHPQSGAFPRARARAREGKLAGTLMLGLNLAVPLAPLNVDS
jgi:hypothetical protein